jgi:PEP-CTERM motif
MKKFLIPVLLGSAACADAATVSFFQNFGPTSIGSPLFSVTLPKFNPALGTLTKVTLTLDGQTSGSTLEFDNEAGVGGTVGLQIGTTITANSSFLSALVATPAQSTSGSVVADDDGAPDYLGGDALVLTGGSGSDSDFNSSTSAPVLASVTGPGTINVDLTNSIFTSTTTSGIFGPSIPNAGSFSGTVTVEYEYNLVPEPSSALLGALGLLALMRRRR